MNLFSNYTEESAKDFLKIRDTPNLSFLIYRDLPELLNKYLKGGKALDFGCGPGISTRFLSNLGFDIIGVDINKEMLKAAFTIPDGIPFAWIKNANLPFKDNKFDLIASIMVLLEMPSILHMQEVLNEISRVLKPGGIFLAVVGSEYFPQGNWMNKSPVNLSKDTILTTGDIFYTSSKITGIIFKDYFYTDNDYRSAFCNSDLKVIEHHKALGKEKDNMPWQLEMQINPFSHYICQKITQSNAIL